MGVAAKNISGITLHAALSLVQNSGSKSSGKTKKELQKMWSGVDYLFIDEVSMIGCNFLMSISDVLCDITGILAPYGGISVIFAGNFGQLPPVGQSSLYSRIPTQGQTTHHVQRQVMGKLLWLSVNTVVLLSQVMRQSGDMNACFVDLLHRLRLGRCSEQDFHLLRTCLLSNVALDWTQQEWLEAPTIVSCNETKDKINEAVAAAFTHCAGIEMHWYYSIDNIKGLPDANHEIVKPLLERLHSGQMHQCLGHLPLAIGMPVMITQNSDMNGGIVNGSTGTLVCIHYFMGDDNK